MDRYWRNFFYLQFHLLANGMSSFMVYLCKDSLFCYKDLVLCTQFANSRQSFWKRQLSFVLMDFVVFKGVLILFDVPSGVYKLPFCKSSYCYFMQKMPYCCFQVFKAFLVRFHFSCNRFFFNSAVVLRLWQAFVYLFDFMSWPVFIVLKFWHNLNSDVIMLRIYYWKHSKLPLHPFWSFTQWNRH